MQQIIEVKNKHMNANKKATNQKPTHNYIMHISDSSVTFLFIQSKPNIQGDK